MEKKMSNTNTYALSNAAFKVKNIAALMRKNNWEAALSEVLEVEQTENEDGQTVTKAWLSIGGPSCYISAFKDGGKLVTEVYAVDFSEIRKLKRYNKEIIREFMEMVVDLKAN